MAIFSFRPPASGRRKGGPQPPPDWDDTRPVEFDDAELAASVVDSRFDRPTFEDSGFAPDLTARSRGGAGPGIDPDALEAGMHPHPGFAKNLTARPQDDEPLGAGWYISSWDLLQGCDVIEGAPIDLLPPEWQRKRPRP